MPEDYLIVEEYRALIDQAVKTKAGQASLTCYSAL
jgi:hypothetical protein